MHSLFQPPRGIDIPEPELPIRELITDFVTVKDRRHLGATALGVVGALEMVSNPKLDQPPELAVFTPSGELITAYGTEGWFWGLARNIGFDERTETFVPGRRWVDVMQNILDGPRDDDRAMQLADTLMTGVDGVYEIETGESLTIEERLSLQGQVSALAIAQRGRGCESIWPDQITRQQRYLGYLSPRPGPY